MPINFKCQMIDMIISFVRYYLASLLTSSKQEVLTYRTLSAVRSVFVPPTQLLVTGLLTPLLTCRQWTPNLTP